MTDRPQRKRIRLTDYDYSAPGAYFITICTREKRCILSRISAGAAVVLSTEGQFVDRAIKNISVIYPGIAVDDYVIMPNHVHILLRIMEQESGRLIAAPTARTVVGQGTIAAPTAGAVVGQGTIAAPTVSTVVGQMKRWVSRQAGTALWQKSFYEHIVRNESDYHEIRTYIDNNPARWTEDRLYPFESETPETP